MKDETYSRPIVFGIDTESFLRQSRGNRSMLACYGQNSGNALFSEALYRSIPNCRRATYQLSDAEDPDVIVVAAANWLSEHADLSWLVKTLEATNLPVVVAGLGAQAGIDHAIPLLKPATERFVRLVSERSTSISTRGAFTAEVLGRYGVQNVVVTGCPSLLLAGEAAPNILKASEVEYDGCVIHATRHGTGRVTSAQAYLYQQALKHELDIILQSEAEVSELDGSALDLTITKNSDDLPLIYGADLADVRRYLARHAQVYWRVDDWISAVSRKRFCVGSRVHGSIAALVAGTPSLLLAHDARCVEMAEAMKIPTLQMDAIDTDKDMNIDALLDATDIVAFQQHYSTYLKRFREFFRANGLST